MNNSHITISPLARAYLAAIRARQITEDSPGLQLIDGAAYLLWRGIDGASADVLRVLVALCEVVAELKEEIEDEDENTNRSSQSNGNTQQNGFRHKLVSESR